jgi:TonB family protein
MAFEVAKSLSRIIVQALITFILIAKCASPAMAQAQPEQIGLSQENAQGIALFQAGDTAGAIALLLKAVKQNANDAEAWHYLGRCYNRTRRTEEAIQAFKTAVKLRPSSVQSRVGLALALQRLNKLNEAVREAEAALKLEPKCEECRYILSLVAINKGDQQKAWREAVALLEISPDFVLARDLRNQALVNIYAQVLSPKLKFREAEEKQMLSQLNAISVFYGIMLDPSMATRDFQVAQGDRFKSAIDFYEKAIAQAPQDADAEEWRERLESLRVWKSIILSGDDALSKQQIVAQKDLLVSPQPLNSPKYEYPDDLRQAGVKGDVWLYAVISEEGRVHSMLVLRALHPVLTQQALTAARQQRFEPAKKDGKPVKTILLLKYNFGTVNEKR